MKYFYLFLGLMVLIIGISACSRFIEKRLIFRPIQLNDNYKYSFHIPFTEANFKSDDASLNTLYFAPIEEIKGTIIYYHGNSQNLAHWAKNAELFVKMGYEIYFYDFRQYGKSKGVISEKALYADALNFYDFVQKTSKQGLPILYGRSLGTTFASYTATKRAAKHLILETPFYNIRDIFKKQSPFGFVPLQLTYSFPTNEFIPQIKCPIHIIQGTKDRVVPYKSAIKLKSLLKEKDSFTTIENANHHNLATFESYHQLLNRIL